MIRVAVESIPAWFVAGIRQMIAAVLMLLILLYKKQLRWIGRKNFLHQVILSSLMLIIANGLTTVAEEELTSSLTSLISACSPVLVFLGSLLFGLAHFTLRTLGGLALCFAGILCIFWDGLLDLSNPKYFWGIILLLFAISGWAAGTIFSKKISISGGNIVLNLFYQFSFAGVAQLILAFSTLEKYHFDEWTMKSFGAVFYLAVLGSVAAFFAFHYALKKISPVQVSILSYFNTIISIFLSWLILDEEITSTFILAAVLIISGIFLINYKKEIFKKKKVLA